MEIIDYLVLRLVEMMNIVQTSTKCIEIELGWRKEKKERERGMGDFLQETWFWREEMNRELNMREKWDETLEGSNWIW